MAQKLRLDLLLVERRLANSRSQAAAMIMAGEVRVNEAQVDKPGARIALDAAIALKAKPRYVGRGGLKLEGALQEFAIDPSGRICADVGASIGGFTDCLLQHGASKVYAIDVGRGILAYRLRIDERVIPLEGTNARYLNSLPEAPQLVAIDVSFISLRHILPAVTGWVEAGADIIALVKPQFEAGKKDVGKGGIVRSPEIHRRVLHEIGGFSLSLGLLPQAVMRSPIKGLKGNQEYLLWLRLDGEAEPERRFQLMADRLFPRE